MSEEHMKAQFEAWWANFQIEHEEWRFADREAILFQAWQAALSSQSVSVPEGWKLVPVELNHKQKQDMVWAYEEATGGCRLPDGDGYDFEIVQKMHEAMLAAALSARSTISASQVGISLHEMLIGEMLLSGNGR